MSRPSSSGFLLLPPGARVCRCADDAKVKALAIRLGVYAQISAGLRRKVPTPGSAALCRDGDALVAIMAWRGFANAREHGWLAFTVTPASEANALWLEALARAAVGSPTSTSIEEADRPWGS